MTYTLSSGYSVKMTRTSTGAECVTRNGDGAVISTVRMPNHRAAELVRHMGSPR
ncbi:hypothetical protein ACFY1Q_11800 [Streptomyces albidoflavus]